MTKIEQLTELLVSELKGFEKGIAKLEALETKMSKSEVKIDLKEFKSLKHYHENAMNESNKVHESYLHRLQSVVKGASFYPKWAIITFMSMILMCCIISFYTYTVKADAIEKEKAAYVNGEQAATEYINLYLSENPKALEQYKKWAESK